jgi:flagellum-specific ATP synthase
MTRAMALIDLARTARFVDLFGEVTGIGQKSLTANGPHCRVGDICEIGTGSSPALAEVVAVGRERVELVPLGTLLGARPGDRVTLSDRHSDFPVGDAYSGRAIDAFGQAIDGGPAIIAKTASARQTGTSMAKTIVRERIETGFRAIDSLLPVARGQRIGVFAASGVGKTTLVEQLSLRIPCDRVVICLIGERGREIERIWTMHQQSAASAPVTVVAATSDESAGVRVRAMKQALALSEAWRERGEHVVLFVDSATRLAMALRDIGLAAGEPPALRSYTPNVFSALPEFVERCGAIAGKGAITAIFTVLSETDDVDDPIVETMKSLLDGHIQLSRRLAERGHFPAIDVQASVSRVADQILTDSALDAMRRFKKAVATYEESRMLIESGMYQPGASDEIDRAIALRPEIQRFLTQSGHEQSTLAESDRAIQRCLAGDAR